MGTPRIVGLKTMNIALRRIQLENVKLTGVQQFSTRSAAKPPTAEGKSDRTSSGSSGSSSGGGGGGTKILLSTAVVVGAGGAAYYYFNGSDPFTWVIDQLPIKKKIPETKPVVTETGGLKLKNKPNQVECATPATTGKESLVKTTKKEVIPPPPPPMTTKPKDDVAKVVVPEKKTEQLIAPANSLSDKTTEAKVEVPPATTSSNWDELKDVLAEFNLPQVPTDSSEAQKSTSEEQNKIIELQKQIEDLKIDYENELMKALTRQAQVYQETIENAKSVIRSEYERRLKVESEISEAEQMVELKAKYGQATAALAAMEVALKGRRDQEVLSESSRKLWAYCNSIFNAINYGGTSDTPQSIRLNKKSLLTEFSNDPFAVQLLNTLPDNVESIEKLRKRYFNVVDSSCRKVALFKNGESVTLWKYLLGVVQGSLVTKCEGNSDSLKTPYEILDKTAFHLQRGEMLQAVWVLNKIEGLPREICRDWLLDARAVLEVNQTLSALMAHANANNSRMN